MKYKLLGKSGLRVSELCLGAMTFGEDWGWGSPKDEAQKVYNAFRESGGNFDLSLSAEQFKTLDEASRIELGFPHEFYDKEMVRSLIYGGMADQIVV